MIIHKIVNFIWIIILFLNINKTLIENLYFRKRYLSLSRTRYFNFPRQALSVRDFPRSNKRDWQSGITEIILMKDICWWGQTRECDWIIHKVKWSYSTGAGRKCVVVLASPHDDSIAGAQRAFSRRATCSQANHQLNINSPIDLRPGPSYLERNRLPIGPIGTLAIRRLSTIQR